MREIKVEERWREEEKMERGGRGGEVGESWNKPSAYDKGWQKNINRNTSNFPTNTRQIYNKFQMTRIYFEGFEGHSNNPFNNSSASIQILIQVAIQCRSQFISLKSPCSLIDNPTNLESLQLFSEQGDINAVFCIRHSGWRDGRWWRVTVDQGGRLHVTKAGVTFGQQTMDEVTVCSAQRFDQRVRL